MLGGDLCKRSTPQVELDQRARDTRLALERIERLIVRAPDRCLPGSGKTFIDAALAYGAKDRRIAPLGALVAGISIVTINSAIIAATVKKTALSVAPPSGGDLAAGIAGEAGCSRRGGHGTTCQQPQGVVFRQPNFVTPRLVSPFLVPPATPGRALPRHSARLGGHKHICGIVAPWRGL